MTHVALLRGINVAGKNKLAMKDLVTVFTAAGCREVRTYIQSGNVVFEAAPGVAAKVPAAVAAGIERRFGLKVPVVTRTAEELREAAEVNPFLKAGEDAERLHVMFLADRPSEDRIAALDPKRSAPDAFVVIGRDVYLLLPNGVGRTKLTNDYFDRNLATTSTVRNWRTVLKLVELSAGA
jgi:uncharacterized protein (DUF1697 family)